MNGAVQLQYGAGPEYQAFLRHAWPGHAFPVTRQLESWLPIAEPFRTAERANYSCGSGRRAVPRRRRARPVFFFFLICGRGSLISGAPHVRTKKCGGEDSWCSAPSSVVYSSSSPF